MSQTNGQKNNNNALSPKTKVQKKPQKNQVSLAGVAKKPERKKKTPQKKIAHWKWIVPLVVVIVLVITLLLLFRWWDKEQKKKLSLTSRQQAEYLTDFTPDELADDVSYYLLGVTGAEIGDPMDMLAVMCYDRKADAVSMIQIPVDTYIDKENGFAVDTIGNVWYNPQPLIACSSCRERVPEKERENGKHVSCGAKLEEWKGSSTGDLIRVINQQYGLPIDNYFILSRAGLVSLINNLKGVRVELAGDITLGEKVYEKGVRTLDGQAAVDYAVTYNYKGTPVSDRERMSRQRQVLAALWERISACSKKDLYYTNDLGQMKGALGKLMADATPIRYDDTSFGIARMLGITDEKAEDIDANDALCDWVMQLGDIPLDKVTISILPGEQETIGTAKVYSVNRGQVIELFNAQMNPYKLTIDETTVIAPQVTEVVNAVDPATATLDTMLPKTGTEEE